MQRAYTPSTSPPPPAFARLSPAKLHLVPPCPPPQGISIKVPQLSRAPVRQLPPFSLDIDSKEKEDKQHVPEAIRGGTPGRRKQLPGVHGKTKQTPAENHMMHKRRAGYTALPPAPVKTLHMRRGVP